MRRTIVAKPSLRARSTLKANSHFMLPLSRQREGFLAIYNKNYSLAPLTMMTALWSLAVSEAATDPQFGKDKAATRARNRYAAELANSGIRAGLTSLEKKSDHFLVTVPVLGPVTENITLLHTIDVVATGGKGAERILPERAQDFVLGPEIIPRLHSLPGELRVALDRCFVSAQLIGTELSLTFRISKEEAQQLASVAWVEIRPIDIYPMMLAWTSSYFGTTNRPAKSSFSVSRIARTLPTDPSTFTRKVNDRGISVNHVGHPVFLPLECNNTQRYEDLFSQAGQNPDNSFSLIYEKPQSDGEGSVFVNTMDPSNPNNPKKLPANIPVLIDWVNNKFSYTTTSGLLEVRDITRYRAASSTHISTFLSKAAAPTDIDLKRLNSMFVTAPQSVGMTFNLDVRESDFEGVSDIDVHRLRSSTHSFYHYWTNADRVLKMQGGRDVDIQWGDLASNSDYPFLRPLGRFIKLAAEAIVANPDNLYNKLSVSWVTNNMAPFLIAGFYADSWSEVKASSNQHLDAAQNQGELEGWESPPLPLIGDHVGRLPHQLKIANILRDSPPFAILPVAAGGGKSLLAITDVLQEISKNRNNPYLIMCPGHLVAQYVKEISFFTKGRLNCIAMNSYVFRRHGVERLTKMIGNAPRNTVVVCDYDVLPYRGEQVCYGTTTVNVFPVAELLKQFDFQYVLLDESQYVSNPGSARTRAVMSLIVEIPMKRLASGTMAHDSPADLVSQISMMDPTLFGSVEDFNEEFGAKVAGGRIVEWKPGGESLVMTKIKSRIVVAGANRREWSALLPPVEEKILVTRLTEKQSLIYQSILQETLELIRQDAAVMKKMEEQEKAESDEDEELDEFGGADLAALLKPYLARLEQFITAPAKDALGDVELQGDDRISPKVLGVIERINLHLEQNIPGKILIFTNYVASAEAIYEALPPDIKGQTILYKASDKIEAGARFEKDPSMKVMVGVEQSMNTGLNLQFVSRLLRVEQVWTPGALEQGNSRVNRPNLKVEESRTKTYYDWIIADGTIDITKMSRLISKIVTIAKFENADNPEYQQIPEVPIIKMSLESIANLNTREGDLLEYTDAYSTYRRVIVEDYKQYAEEFRARYGDELLFPIGEAPVPQDAKLMKALPYVSGLEIYGSDQLGLVRLDEYLNSEEFGDDLSEAADSDDEEVANKGTKEHLLQVRSVLVGQRVHTEFGEGEVASANKMGVQINMDDGSRVFVRYSAAFLITRADTSTKDVRRQLLKSTGAIPIDTPIDVPAPAQRERRLTKREIRQREKAEKERQVQEEQEVEESLIVDLSISVSNGFLGITFFTGGEDSPQSRALEALGFRPTPQFYYAEMKTHLMVERLITKWNELGFEPDPDNVEAMSGIFDMYGLIKRGAVSNMKATYRLANKNNLKNFYRMNQIPNNDKKLIKPYPIVEDGSAYLALPVRGQMGTKEAIRVKVSGVRWYMSDPSLTYYALKPTNISAMMHKILGAGIQVSNIAELRKIFRKLQRSKPRDIGDNPFSS